MQSAECRMLGVAGWVVVGLLILPGCGPRNEKAAPLRTGVFAPQEGTIATDPMSPVDRSGPLASEDAVEGGAHRRPAKAAPNGGSDRLSAVVQENMEAPGARAATMQAAATTAPVSPGLSSGQYMTIGGLLAEVNSTPIYADKVLAQIAHVLAARAKEVSSREKFREAAKQEVRDQVQKLVTLELEYAAAQRNLDQHDRGFAADLTADWRRHKIAEAQGSEALARKRAAEQGISLEDMVDEQYRFFMSQIYYQKRLVPRIQVTVNDMRRYYYQHVGSDFTVRDTARFRLIKISVKQVGDRTEARKKIADIRERVVSRGEDFAGIAGTTNDPVLLRSQGELTVQRGAFAESAVEQAVWAIPIGEVTPIVETPDAFYVAKVEERKNGRIIPFEEESTQVAIKEKLKAEQFKFMREQVQADLRKDAIIRSNDEMMNTAIEMALQNYPAWSGKS